MSKGTAAEWRTVQFFIHDQGVSEVQVDLEDQTNVRCTCATTKFKITQIFKRNKCKHAEFVREIVKNNDGAYTFQIPTDISDLAAAIALDDAESFREFVIRNAVIEVL